MDAKGRAELGDLLMHRSGLAPPADGADLTSLQVTASQKRKGTLEAVLNIGYSCVGVRVGGFGGVLAVVECCLGYLWCVLLLLCRVIGTGRAIKCLLDVLAPV